MFSLSFIRDNIKRFNVHTKQLLNSNYAKAWAEEIYCIIRFGCSPDDYFRYEFYKKSNTERNKFITFRRSQQIIKKYNRSSQTNILNDKVKFNTFFHDYIKRNWIEIGAVSKKELKNFCAQYKSIIVKPINGGQGHGIFLWHNGNSNSDVDTLATYSGYIAEEILTQHPKMKRLNPSSVNTVRILTFKGEIVAAALRIGGDGAIVDNLHSNGVCGHIDIPTGIIDVPCIDMNFNKYIYHPTTHEKLVGFEIPLWEQAKAEVVNAANAIPDVQYIGWDVAILSDSIALIEGNHDPGHDVVQMIAQTGLYTDILHIQSLSAIR